MRKKRAFCTSSNRSAPRRSRLKSKARWRFIEGYSPQKSLRICALQKALRINIHFELQRALRLGCGSEPFPQIGGEVEAARSLDQQPKAIAAAHHRKRRFGGTQHANVVVDG